MQASLDLLLTVAFWAAALRIATPLIFGVAGAVLCERAGVLNLGIEGIMTAGAMTGWLAVHLGAGLWGGVLVAMLTGAGLGLLLAGLTVKLGLSQHVSGLAVTLLATSASYFGYRLALPGAASPPRIEPFRPLDLPVLSDLPVLGPILFQQTALTLLAIAAILALGLFLARTPLGLALRAVGENPAAVEAQGIDVHALRLGAVVAGSALMALGGAFLTLSAFNAFFFEMVAGRGWICIALTAFAGWRPAKALLGAVLFGAFDAFQVRLQQASGGVVPGQVFLMLPYLLSIAALLVGARRSSAPKALMRPYIRGER
jgi:ABC-type uncharacterized transport system permease subunit